MSIRYYSNEHPLPSNHPPILHLQFQNCKVLHPGHGCLPGSFATENHHSAPVWTPRDGLYRPEHSTVGEGVFLAKHNILPQIFESQSLRETTELVPQKWAWTLGFLTLSNIQNQGLGRDAGLRADCNFALLPSPCLPLSESTDCKVIVSPFCLANKYHSFSHP